MAVKTIQIADKPTIDEIKALLENSGYGLEALKNAIGSGSGSEASGGGLHVGKIIDNNVTANVSVSTLPYNFYDGSAVVYNNEIHILGGHNSSSDYTRHYKFDGTSWTSVSTLPYNFYDGSAVVYNNEIHILGGSNSSSDSSSDSSSTERTKHYKFDGTSWTTARTLPYVFYQGSAVVYNNEIHILGSNISGNYTRHYKFDGTSWTSVSTLPYNFYSGSAVVYNNEIHILGGSSSDSSYISHYKYDGTSWTSVSTLPYNFYDGSAVVYNNEIHILGSSNYYKYHYKFNGTSWEKTPPLPYDFYSGSAVVYNNEIHILGGSNSSTSHYAIKNDYRYIKILLPQGVRILLPDNQIIDYISDNATKKADNTAVVNSGGYVEIITNYINSEDNDNSITFY